MTLDPFSNLADASGVTVAVLDTGVAYEDHSDGLGVYARAPDLDGVLFASGYDFINDDSHPNDDQRHGTHVTGVIAASSGIASIAPGATILPIKVLDGGNSGTELALAEGLRFAADEGAQVANMSLSFPPTYFPSRLLQSAVDYAAKHGVIMIAAAGNHDEQLVSYPAAFRDVIAVGASDLPEDYSVVADGGDEWADLLGVLERASYSNHAYKLDVLAPAGTIPGDANGDGKPEGVLAQTFTPGDPTDFGYYFYAGTSQAAAEVSAVAAVLLADNPALDAFQVRALLVENAKRLGAEVLDFESGRGAVRAHKTMAAAGNPHATDARPRWFANVAVTLHNGAGGGTFARAHVEVIDDAGKPAAGVGVYGMFTGAAFTSVVGASGPDGVVTFDSPPLEGNLVVAFQVDALLGDCKGPRPEFDRPRGFVRIDSLSLEMLATFGQGISSSPSGISSSPSSPSGAGGVPEGSGPSSSPSIPLPTDPGMTPISVAYDPALFAGTGYRPTLLLPNFSWGLATAPMAVAVDESWFLATFPKAAERRVLSYGRGWGGSGFLFDTTSFQTAPAVRSTAPTRIPMILLTFSSGISSSPSSVSSSPSSVSSSPSSLWTDVVYSGIDGALAAEYQQLLNDWYAAAAGISSSPSLTGGLWTMDAGTFEHLSFVVETYLGWATLESAAPAGSYGDALSAAYMPLAPVSETADGEGLGISALP
jgi:hypothetical protein